MLPSVSESPNATMPPASRRASTSIPVTNTKTSASSLTGMSAAEAKSPPGEM
jgi:hypothetical protein